MIVMSKFVETLKELVDESGLSVQDIAKKTGIHRSCLYGYLSGKNLPTLKRAVILADFFGCNLDYLVGKSDYKNSVTPKELPPFCETLARAVDKSGKTKYKITRGAGVEEAAFFRWLKGDNEPSVENLEKIADYLGYTLDGLLGRN